MINNIIISKKSRMVIKKDSRLIGISGENLQETLIFNIDEPIDGTAVVEILFPDNTKGFIELSKTERGYELPIKSNLLKQQGYISMQLRILQNNQEVFKSMITEFEVERAINATETIPDQYPTWLDNLETLKTNLEKAESERVTAEQGRIEAETQREEIFIERQEDISNAIKTIQDKKAEYDKNALDKTNEYDKNAENQTKTYNDNAKNKLDAYNDNTVVKINEFNEHVQDKKAEYDKHVENHNKRLDSVESKNTEQDKEIESLKTECQVLKQENTILKNQIPKGQAEGNPIHLKDSSDMEMNWKLKGGHRQEKREGYNLLDFNVAQDSKVTVNEDGSITINGQGGFAIAFSQIKLEANKTYKQKIELISGTIKNSSGVDMTNQAIMSFTSNLWLNKDAYISYIPQEDELKKGFWLHQYAIFNNARIKIWGYEGTDDKPYEQYGASPSSEYPSEIETVGSNVNILNIPDIEETERNGIKYSVKNGILRLNGTASASFEINLSSNIQIKKGKYTHSSNYIQKGLYVSFDNLRSTMLSTQNGRKYSFELTEDKLYSKYFIWIDKGTVLNDVEIRLKLEEGETATPWSPYGMGSVEIDVVNKNFFDMKAYNYLPSWQDFAIKENGFKLSSRSNGNWYDTLNYKYFLKDISKEITISFDIADIKVDGTSNYCRILIDQYGENNEIVGANYYDFYNTGKYSKSISLKKNSIYIILRIYIIYDKNIVGTYVEFKNFQLEKGSTATDIEPHQSQKQIIPIQQEMLEEDYIEDVEHHEWGKLVLTGKENNINLNAISSNGIAQFHLVTKVYKNPNTSEITAISNCFLGVHWDKSWLKNNCITTTTDGYAIRIMTVKYKTVEEFKNYLKQKYDEGNPVIVYYKLAEAIDLELTAEQKAIRGNKLHTCKNITNISVDNELAKTEVKYYKDLTTMMNNLANASIGGN